jgi:hypothetical protein
MEEKLGKIRSRKKLKINNDIYVKINVIIDYYCKNTLYLFNIGFFVVVVFVASVVVAVSQELRLRLN